MRLLARDQAFEDGEHPLAVLVYPVEIGAEGSLEIPRVHPLVNDDPWHVNILPERVKRMPAEKETVEKSGLPLGGKRIGIVSRTHLADSFSKRDILAMVEAADQVLWRESL
jgi:hypothetical protein